MQNAYASGHVTQLMGRLSWAPGDAVQVASGSDESKPHAVRLASLGATYASSVVTQPVS
jgi:hypothetical protein